MGAKRNALALLVIGACGAPALAQDPHEILSRSLTRQFNLPVSIVQVRTFDRSNVMMKVESDETGNMRITMLHPISLQGIVTVDDGRRTRIFEPDEREIRSMMSPRVMLGDPGMRSELIRRNYRLSLQPAVRVAGRLCHVIRAEPRAEGLETRVVFVDRELGITLRYEVLRGDGSRLTLFDTKTATSRPAGFRVSTDLPEGKEEKSWGPLTVNDRKRARRMVGFTPRDGDELPLGFHRVAIHIVGSEERPFIGLRLTDGLATATVYQWQPSRFRDGRPFRTTVTGVDDDGVMFSAAGNIPEYAIRRLVEHFAGSSKSPRRDRD